MKLELIIVENTDKDKKRKIIRLLKNRDSLICKKGLKELWKKAWKNKITLDNKN